LSAVPNDKLAAILHEYSGGIPRIVESMLLNLTNLHKYCTSIEDVRKMLEIDGEIGKEIYQSHGPSPVFPVIENPILRNQFTAVLIRRILGIPFKSNDKEFNQNTLDMLGNLVFYVKQEKENLIPIFSKYMITWLENNREKFSAGLLVDLLKQLSYFPNVLNQGRFGELVIAQTIVLRTWISKSKNISDTLPCFQKTFLANLNSPSRILSTFSFNVNTNEGTPTGKSFNQKDWPKFLQELEKEKCECALLIPRSNTSAGPDMFITTNDIANGPLAVVSNKLYVQGAISGWPEIRDEINLCLNIPKKNGVKNPIVMLFVSTHLNNEVSSCLQLHEPASVFDAGEWGIVNV
jgi:hypothetical protein